MHPLAGLLCQRQPNILQLQSNVSHDNVMTVPQGDAKVYEAECASSPGFSVNFTNQESRGTTYAEFRKLNLKWQQKVGKVRRLAFSRSDSNASCSADPLQHGSSIPDVGNWLLHD